MPPLVLAKDVKDIMDREEK